MTALARMLVTFKAAADFTSEDPVLRLGEMGVETDTEKLKIGDAVTAWTSLSYVAGDPAALGTMAIQNANAVAITGGAIDGTLIGTTTPDKGAFTSLSSTGNATLGDAVGDAHAITGTLRNTPGTNKHILSASVTASAITDFTTGGAGCLFSRPDDGVDGMAAAFQYINSGGLYNFALVARDELVFATGGAGLYGSAIDRGRVGSTGDLLWKHSVKSNNATAGVGYATGAGGTVTQITNKATGVTLNKACGQITMNNATLNAGVAVTFTLTNSAIAAADLLVLKHAATGTLGNYQFVHRCAAGSATISVRNVSAGNLSEAVVIGFAVVKGVTS